MAVKENLFLTKRHFFCLTLLWYTVFASCLGYQRLQRALNLFVELYKSNRAECFFLFKLTMSIHWTFEFVRDSKMDSLEG